VLSVAVLLFGASLVYGYTGTTDFVGIGRGLAEADRDPLLLASVLFVIVGFGFKVSAVPFHFKAPDTYEGSPIPVTAFLSVASKAAGFAGLLQVCFVAFEPVADVYAPVLGVVAVLTMTIGNLTALQQRNVVRLFAYSSIAHAGYMLVPFALVVPGDLVVNEVSLNSTAQSAVLFYLLAYSVMNIGAFACVAAVARQLPDRQIRDYAGLGSHSPGLAFGLTLFLMSLSGALPIVVGFYAKLFVLQPIVVAPSALRIGLAAAVVINSLIGLYYYLVIARTIWIDAAPADAQRIRPGFALSAVIAVLSAAVLAVGVLPDAFGAFTDRSTLAGPAAQAAAE